MNIKKGLIIIGVLTSLSVFLPVASYFINFRGYPLSLYTLDWANFGQYLGGTVGPLVSIINLTVVVYIAIAVYRLETNRERETSAALARPLAHLSSGDYENDIFVKISNLGMGPMVNIKCQCYPANQKDLLTSDLVDLMPDLDGYKWTTFTIGGPPFVIRPGDETFLIRLEGNETDNNFQFLRDIVRTRLKDIIILIDYEDMFENKMKTTGGILTWFGRHDQHNAISKKKKSRKKLNSN